ncbi:hypothetical protein A2125_02645 [Candidatus Woesebacteria bacterium GWB1_43_5]|uniref:CAAX prenyl protease 2/Lysostaphin resistance protein A-like domain-containing protein n=1 Tax=Candidatus Woesebacteria bacterium GWB1_43_5 TaxID=1802474 RepID=A0A1F7WST5_9BACT|nr:MAG: hypothetical protein A2125_02645 [Candidatus Woesebacteria bacterium GWB1_43_5]
MPREIYYLFLILVYSTVPPFSLNFVMKKIYKEKDKSAWHTFYFYKYLITLSFLPILFLPGVDLGLAPKWSYSLPILLLIILCAVFFYRYAKREKVAQFYIGGVHAAFMEEILYRGIIFGLAKAIWGNEWIALAVSSLLFGAWHLKNFPWLGSRGTTWQFLYTAFYAGPLLCLLRIVAGDLYLSIFVHFMMDTTVALAPEWLRKTGLIYSPKPVDI